MWAQRKYYMSTQWKDSHLQAKERGLRRNRPWSTLILDIQPLEPWKNKLLMFKPPVLCIMLWHSQQTSIEGFPVTSSPRTTQTDGKIYRVLGLEESILLKWLYYPRQSTDSMQSLSNYRRHFHRTRTKYFTVCMETQKTPNTQSSLEGKKQSWRNQTPWLQTIL